MFAQKADETTTADRRTNERRELDVIAINDVLIAITMIVVIMWNGFVGVASVTGVKWNAPQETVASRIKCT